MSSPSSAKINASSSRIVRATKKDIGSSSVSRSSRAFGASSISNSSRKVAGVAQGQSSSQSARVYLDGVDVTPQSLLLSRIKPSSSHDHRGNKAKISGKVSRSRATNPNASSSVIGASVILSSDQMSVSSLEDTADDSSSGPLTRGSSSNQSSNATTPSGPSKPPVMKPVPPVPQPPPMPTANAAASEQDDDGGSGVVGPEVDGMEDVKSSRTDPDRGNNQTIRTPLEKQPRRAITIQFAETPTIMLFELRSVCVGLDSLQHQAVVARNKQYHEVCATKKGSDKFIEGRSQTLQLAQKTKEVMTAPPATRDAACVATDWDIFDCAKMEDEAANDHDDLSSGVEMNANASSGANAKSKSSMEGENADVVLKRQVDEIVDATMASPGCVLDVDGDIVDDLRARQHALRARNKHKHGHGGNSSLGNSQKSRILHGSAPQSSNDIGRSTANVLHSNNSNSSMQSPNVSFGASQDVSSALEDGGGSNSSNQNSQVGLSTTSHGVLSGGDSSGDDNKQNPYARANTNVDIGEIIAQQKTSKVLASQSLLKTVSVVERAVQQNVYHAKHVLYRNFPSLASDNNDVVDWRHGTTTSSPIVPPFASFLQTSKPSKGGLLEKLWAFQCDLTRDRSVSCLAWNTVNEDLLAVSYVRRREPPLAAGSSSVVNAPTASTVPPPAPVSSLSSGPMDDSSGGFDGLVLFWSLKNPEYPERIYNLKTGVTSIDFSHTHPYLLALGSANGVVAIYDTRKDESAPMLPISGLPKSTTTSAKPNGRPQTATLLQTKMHEPTPIATSETSNGKHLDAVWQVKWISKGSDRGENVVSISSDGRVTEWSMKKGLSFSDLMTLKRVVNPLLGSESRTDGVISRQASGQCIDFAKNDPSVYFVGTEDGMIHKCSVSYNEQYLQTYYGHTGPVYQILVSPFCSDLFLSCSGDWNMKLWHQNEQKEALTFRSVDLAHAVHSISWCPSDATIFGAVTEDGRIEIWDLQQSILDPIVTHYPKKFVRRSAGLGSGAGPTTSAISTTTARDNRASNTNLDDLDDPLTPKDPLSGTSAASGATETSEPQELPLECTKIAFAPSAPVIVVGDSTGDVTVYRVPTLAEARCDGMSHEEQVARLLKAMNPNKHV